MKIQPVRPEDVQDHPPEIPERVIEACNNLIRRKFYAGAAAFFEVDLLLEISLCFNVAPLHRPFFEYQVKKNDWLRVEHVYREAGWIVRRTGQVGELDTILQFMSPGEGETHD